MLNKSVQETIRKRSAARLAQLLPPAERSQCETILMLLQEIEKRDAKIEAMVARRAEEVR